MHIYIGNKLYSSWSLRPWIVMKALRIPFEETVIPLDIVDGVRCRLSTLITRGDLQVLLLWFTGQLTAVPADLSCTEGMLEFHDIDALPIGEMVPTASKAIPFMLALPDDDARIYNGCLDVEGDLITNRQNCEW